jgi:O-methyltransferase
MAEWVSSYWGFDLLKTVLRRIRRIGRPVASPPIKDVDRDALATMDFVKSFTMTPAGRQFALIEAVRHIVKSGIPGAFVECGVWRGGSAMAIARTLIQLNDTTRDIHLFDTFDGMTHPEEVDRKYDGRSAETMMTQYADKETGKWFCIPESEVRENMRTTGYPMERVNLVAGKVEDSLPAASPPCIALLRLDTDWYRSTLHELECLYPNLAPGGVLVIDDYGYFQGAKKAVDEYVERNNLKLFLCRVDDSCRIAVKNI